MYKIEKERGATITMPFQQRKLFLYSHKNFFSKFQVIVDLRHISYKHWKIYIFLKNYYYYFREKVKSKRKIASAE